MSAAEEIKSETVMDRIEKIENLLRGKERLPDAVFKYAENGILRVLKKSSNQESIFEKDMEFVNNFEMWLGMDKEDKEKFPSIEEMLKNDGCTEAIKRHISSSQWKALNDMVIAYEEILIWRHKRIKWIDENFDFPGNGKIVCERALNLYGRAELKSLPKNFEVTESLYLNKCTGLTALPEGLRVKKQLSLNECTNLTTLPDDLKVEGELSLISCTSLEKLPDTLSFMQELNLGGCENLTSLPNNLRIQSYLEMAGCTRIVNLPSGLKVGGHLSLNDCTSLMGLPDNMEINGNLFLTANLNKKVKSDAIKLKETGKIKGEIKYG